MAESEKTTDLTVLYFSILMDSNYPPMKNKLFKVAIQRWEQGGGYDYVPKFKRWELKTVKPLPGIGV